MTTGRMNLDGLLEELRCRDIRLAVVDGRIRVRGTTAQLGAPVVAALRDHKEALLALLEARDPWNAEATAVETDPDALGRAPLSAGQERLAFVHDLTGASSTYNVGVRVRIRGDLRRSELRLALDEVLRRHAALRTVLVERDGVLGQDVLESRPVVLQEHDVSASFEPRRTAVTRLEEVLAEPFVLSQGPLVRFTLVKVDAREHVLGIVAHHVIVDGWSMSVFVRELAVVYHLACSGRPLHEGMSGAAQYPAYAAAQARAGDQAAQRAYWERTLQGVHAGTIPGRRPPGEHPPRVGGAVPIAIGEPTWTRIQSLASQHGCTAYSLLLATYAEVLWAFGAPHDLPIGSIVANRDEPTRGSMIGFVANTVVVRLRRHAGDGFVDQLERTHDAVLGALDHVAFPFGEVRRLLGRLPFHVAFVFQNIERPAVEAGGSIFELEFARPDGSPEGTAKFDLTINLAPTRDGLQGILEYDRDRIDESIAFRVARAFVSVVERVARRGLDQGPWRPPVGSLAESHILRHEWAEPTVVRVEHATLHGHFAAAARGGTGRIAIVSGREHCSYGELRRRSTLLGGTLVRGGVGVGDRVGVCTRPSPGTVIAMLGVLEAGATFVPIDPEHPEHRRRLVLEDAGVTHVVVDETTVGLGWGPRVETWDVSVDHDGVPVCPSRPRLPGAPAYCIYTSGTTGVPKGVLVTHHNVLRLFAATAPDFALGDRDVWTWQHSAAFDFSVWEIWGALLHGGRVVVVDRQQRREPVALHRLVAEQGVTVLSTTPAAFRGLAEIERELPVQRRARALRLVTFGGDTLTSADVSPWSTAHDRRSTRLVNMYGITETTVHVTAHDVREASAPEVRRIGRPLRDLQVFVVDERLDEVPIGFEGELLIGGDGVALGYLGRPALTAARFVPDPFSGRTGARLYRSGDRGRVSPRGVFEFAGRMDRQVKIRGHRIELGEVEAAVSQLEGVSQCVVERVEHDDRPRLVGYYVPSPLARAEPTRLLHALAQRLPEHAVPHALVPIEAVPLSANGKVDRGALGKLERGPLARVQRPVAPWTAEQESLCSIWSTQLGRDDVGIDDDFFELGGDSILAVRVAALARARGLPVDVRVLYEERTVRRSLAANRAEPRDEPMPAGLGTEARFPVSSLQAGMLFHSRLHASSTIYNEVASVRIEAPWVEDAMRRCVDQLVARHGILRTTFELGGEQAVQIVSPTIEPQLEFVDWSRHQGDPERAVREWVERASYEPHQVSVRPPWSLAFHRLSEDAFHVGFRVHHCLIDGWSLATLIAELVEGYAAAMGSSTSPPLPPPSHGYREFVAAERRALASDASRRFWSEVALRHSLQPLPRTRVGEPAHRAPVRTLVLDVPPSRLEGLRRLAKAAGAPLKSVLCAVHCASVARATGQAEAWTGLVMNGRLECDDGDRVIGLFVNALPLCARWVGTSWTALVADVFGSECRMLPHRRFPMQEIQRMAGGGRLFDTAFNYIHFHVYDRLEGLGDVVVGEVGGFEQNDFALTANFRMSPGQTLRLELAFDAAQVGEAGAQRIADIYRAALASAATAPDLPIRIEPSAVARHQQRHEWNDTRRETQEDSIVRRFEHACERGPGRIAIESGGRSVSYGGLRQASRGLAAALRAAGVRRGDRVGIVGPCEVESALAMLAVLQAGGAYVPVDVAHPRRRVLETLTSAKCRVVVAWGERASVTALVEAGHVVVDPNARLDAGPGPHLDPADAAYVMYTSGTTGRPKGVVIPHRAVTGLVTETSFCRFRPGLRIGQIGSFAFDAATFEFWGALLHGGCVVIVPRAAVLDPRRLGRTIRDRAVAAMFITAALFRDVATQYPVAFASLETLLAGGDAVDPHSAQAVLAACPGLDLRNGYGPTETTTFAAHGRIDPRPGAVAVPVGFPLRGGEIAVLDAYGHEVPIGASAEVCIGGNGVADGYLDEPRLTAARFVPHPHAAAPGQRLYRSGDMGALGEDGRVWIEGRVDHQVKVRGVRIELGEVEAALRAVENVGTCAVVAVREDNGCRLIAFLTEAVGRPTPEVALRTALSLRLPAAMIPSRFEVVDALPRSSNDKVDRRALETWARELAPARGAGPVRTPQTPTEAILAEMWCGLLRTDAVSAESDFFALGGHSLLALRLAARVERVFSIPWFSVARVFECRRLGPLAREIDRATTAGGGAETLAFEVDAASRRGALSAGQAGLVLTETVRGPAGAYNVPCAVVVPGALDRALLDEVFACLADRHAGLRTVFRGVGGQGAEQELRPGSPLVSELDLSDVDAGVAERFLDHEANRPFVLEGGVLLRAWLGRLTGGRSLLLLVAHHAIIDGGSLARLRQEISEIHAALVRGEAPERRARATPLDYARWEGRLRASEVARVSVDYWRERLREPPAAIRWTRRQDSPTPRRSCTIEFSIPPPSVAALREFCRRNSVTTYAVGVSLLAVLVNQYTGRRDFIIGCPVSGRAQPALEELVGFLVTTLPLRLEVDPDASFETLVLSVRDAVVKAFQHRFVPLQELIDMAGAPRDPSGRPLVQIVASHQIRPEPEELAGRPAQWFVPHLSRPKFDLDLALEEHGSDLHGSLTFDPELFSEAMARSLAERYVQLAALAVTPNARVSELRPWGASSRHLLRHEWAGAAWPVAEPDLRTHWHRVVAARGDAVAICEGANHLTYGRLAAAASRLGRAIRAAARPDARAVGICVRPSIEALVAIVGAIESGLAYVPIDVTQPAERSLAILHDAGVDTLVLDDSDDPLATRFTGARIHVRHPETWGHHPSVPVVQCGARPAYMMFTSGSTGKPKGVVVPHRAVVRLVKDGGVVDFGPERVFAQLANLAFDAATFEVWGALSWGARLEIVDRDHMLTPGGFAAELARTRADTMFLTAAFFAEVGRLDASAFGSVRHLMVGGDVVPADVAAAVIASRRPPRQLINGYGPTECTTFAVCGRYGSDEPTASVPLGRPIGNTTVRIVGPNLDELPLGAVGELCIGGPGCADGYGSRPRLTASRFVPDPFATTPGARLYRTGDRVRFLRDGRIDFVGRVDHQVKLRGYRIELQEIEAHLRTEAAVGDAVVVVHGSGGRARLLAAVTPGEAKIRFDGVAVRSRLRERLPDYMVPAEIFRVDRLPLNRHGKLDRAAVSDLRPTEPKKRAAGVPAAGPVAQAWAIWCDVLGVDAATSDMEADFFELGGNSLLATGLLGSVEAELGVQLQFSELFEEPSFGQFAAKIRARVTEAALQRLTPVVRTGRSRGPLSYAQERLWFIDRLEPGSPAYNVPAVLSLGGRLQRAAFERAVERLVDGHAALRTRLGADEGVPWQEVRPRPGRVVSWVDLSALSRPEARAQVVVEAFGREPFQLEGGPLFRALVVLVPSGSSLAVLATHHVVSDGASVAIMVDELSQHYAAEVRGEARRPEHGGVGVLDHALWQRQAVGEDELVRQRAYWAEALAGAVTVLDLPVDRPFPQLRDHRARTLPFSLQPAELDALKRWAAAHRLTLYMALLWAFGSVLARACAQREVLVGSPVSGRRHPDLRGTVGMLVTTVPMRVGADPSATIEESVDRLRQRVVAAYDHMDYPLEQIVVDLGVERSLQRAPLVQAVFALQDPEPPAVAAEGLTISRIDPDARFARFDLDMGAMERDGGLVGSLTHVVDVLDDTSARRLVEGMCEMLRKLPQTPDHSSVRALMSLPPATKHLLCEEWGAGRPGAQRSDLIARFSQVAARRPFATALCSGRCHVSYAELHRRGLRAAARLREHGVGRGRSVAIRSERSLDLVTTILAVVMSGAAYVPMDADMPASRGRQILIDAGVDLEVCAEGIESLATECPSVAMASILSATDAGPSALPEVGPDDLVYVMYTSGSTGRPKGVAVTQAGVGRLAISGDCIEFDERRRFGNIANPAFDAATFEIWGALLHGATLEVIRKQDVVDVPRWCRVVARRRVDTMFVTSALFTEVARLQPDAFGHLRDLLVGGEAVDAGAARRVLSGRPPRRLTNGYGPTECTTFAVCGAIDDVEPGAFSVPLGTPISETVARVLDDELELLPPGTWGELCLGGDGLARGYRRAPRSTAARFVPDPLGPAGSRMYRTGDVARFRNDGRIEFRGRLDRQIKLRGHRIELAEVETVVDAHPDVDTVRVVVRDDGPGGRQLVAFVVSDGVWSRDELRRFVADRLPSYMVPGVFVPLRGMPMLANGKVDHKALETLEIERQTAAVAVPRLTAMQELLATFWHELLGVEEVGPDDNFFDLGGHSLLATQLVAQIASSIDVELEVRTIFEQPTLRGLEAAIDWRRAELVGRSSAPLAAGASLDVATVAASPAQEGVWFADRLGGTGPQYNVPAAFELDGRVEVRGLCDAVWDLVTAHDALRSRLPDHDGVPVIEEVAAGFGLAIVDVSGVPHDGVRSELASTLVAREIRRPFDLATGPLFRGVMIRETPTRHRLVLNSHHAICDGWSIAVMMRDLGAAYRARIEGASPDLTRGVCYRDYALWQRGRLGDEVAAQQRAYWRRQLGGIGATTGLPCDRPREPGRSRVGGEQRIEVPAALVARLRGRAREENATLFMVLLSMFGAVVSQLRGDHEVVIGSPVSGRGLAAVDDLVGLFVNMLPLRLRLAGDPSLRDAVGEARDRCLGAYANQDLPFERVVTELGLPRDAGTHPVFQTVFVLQDADVPELALKGVRTHAIPPSLGVAKFDLELGLGVAADGALRGGVVFDRGLFDATTVRRFVALFIRALERVADGPQRRISELVEASGADRQLALREWNDVGAEAPPSGGLWEGVEPWCRSRANAVAVADATEYLSYGELERRSHALAVKLSRVAPGLGQRVAVHVERLIDRVVALVALSRAGMRAVMFDSTDPRGWRDRIVEHGAIAVLIGADWKGSAGTVTVVDPTSIEPENGTLLSRVRGAAGLVVVQSFDATGPVALEVSEAWLEASVQTQVRRGGPQPRILVRSDGRAVSEAIGTWSALLAGGTVVSETSPMARGASSLRDAFTAPRRADEPPGEWLEVFGPSDVSATVARAQPVDGGLELGRPFGWAGVHVLGPQLQPRVPQAAGELTVAVGTADMHFVARPRLSAARFVPDPNARTPGARLLRTGRAAMRTPRGPIRVSGLDGTIGQRCSKEVAAVQAACEQHLEVLRCAALGEGLSGGGGVHAFITLRDEAAVAHRMFEDASAARERRVETAARIRSWLASDVPARMCPDEIVVVDELPLRSDGSFDRARLLDEHVFTTDETAVCEPARTPVEQFLVETWSELFEREVGRGHDFFELGGHSLLAMRALSRVVQHYSVEIPVERLFEHPTVAGFAEVVQEALGEREVVEL